VGVLLATKKLTYLIDYYLTVAGAAILLSVIDRPAQKWRARWLSGLDSAAHGRVGGVSAE
jgi:peptidoglycan/LPS O-acetylase OafA/YrhL